MQDFKVSVPKSPWDKPKQKASWEQGFHAGKVGLGLRVSCDFYWQSGWKAGRQYALALEEKAQHDRWYNAIHPELAPVAVRFSAQLNQAAQIASQMLENKQMPRPKKVLQSMGYSPNSLYNLAWREELEEVIYEAIEQYQPDLRAA